MNEDERGEQLKKLFDEFVNKLCALSGTLLTKKWTIDLYAREVEFTTKVRFPSGRPTRDDGR